MGANLPEVSQGSESEKMLDSEFSINYFNKHKLLSYLVGGPFFSLFHSYCLLFCYIHKIKCCRALTFKKAHQLCKEFVKGWLNSLTK